MDLITFFKKVFKDDIVRRVFIKNTFDGVITVLGILIALFFAQIIRKDVVILSCLGSGIAMAVSGIWGAYLTESTERTMKIKKLENQMLKSLINTKIGKDSQNASIIVALFDGLSPLIATLIILIPFFLMQSSNLTYIISFVIAFCIMIFLGVLLSKFANEKVMSNVVKMITAGIALSIILYLLEFLKIV